MTDEEWLQVLEKKVLSFEILACAPYVHFVQG